MFFSYSARQKGGSGFFFELDLLTYSDMIKVSKEIFQTALSLPTNVNFNIDPISGELVLLAQTEDEQLAVFKTKQAAAILQANQQCQDRIYLGFKSKALGSIHTYPASLTDQINLGRAVSQVLINNTDETLLTSLWCSDSKGKWELIPHTPAQLKQVSIDQDVQISNMRMDNLAIQQKIQDAITEEQLLKLSGGNP